MPTTNEIQIDGSGNITLQNIHGSTITITKGDDAQTIIEKLKQLHEAQLDALQKELKNQGSQFKELLELIKNTAHHKPTLPQELTIYLPKVEDLTKIIGRDKDLSDVRDLLVEKQKVVVVNGLGGIGKTTLAQAYLTQYGGEYAHILWLTQSEGDNFVLDLITAQGLAHNLGITTEGKDSQTLFIEILSKIKSITAQPNLWVIDNANASLHLYFDYLPKPPNWHILATSREKIERFFVKDLDFLSEEDAVLLFKSHCQRITDEAAIRSVLKAIDYHTLTIEILAKTAQRNDTPIATLQQAIEKDLKVGVYIRHNNDKIERVTSYLLSIFELNTLSSEEQRLLQHFAALPTEFITYELLKTLIPADEDGIAPTLQDLTDKGWLLHQNDPETYKMHRIIQEVVKRKLPPTVLALHNLIENVSNLLNIDQTSDNPVHKFPIIPFGEAVLSLFPDATYAVIGRLQNNLALVIQYLGDFVSAKDLLEKAMQSSERNFGKDHHNTATTYSNLALVLKDLGDYTRAKDLLEKAKLIEEANFGENHPRTAGSYSNLAMVLIDLEDYPRAKELLDKAMCINKSNFGENHPTTALSYSNLATVLKAFGDNAGAKKLLEKAMLSNEANFSINHPTTALSYSNLAFVLSDLKEYERALLFMFKAYKILTNHFESHHSFHQMAINNFEGIAAEMLQNGYTMENLQKLINN